MLERGCHRGCSVASIDQNWQPTATRGAKFRCASGERPANLTGLQARGPTQPSTPSWTSSWQRFVKTTAGRDCLYWRCQRPPLGGRAVDACRQPPAALGHSLATGTPSPPNSMIRHKRRHLMPTTMTALLLAFCITAVLPSAEAAVALELADDRGTVSCWIASTALCST